MFYFLLGLFLLFPILEISLLIQLGKWVGVLPTVFLVLLTAFLGAYFTRQQGLLVLSRLRQELAQGQLPHQSILESVIILAAGILLLTPGFLTDALGFYCLIPLTRKSMLSPLQALLTRFFLAGGVFQASSQSRSRQTRPGEVNSTYTVEP